MGIVWPPSLPQKPLVEGWSEKAPNIAKRTEMDAGVPKVRKRFTNAVRPVEAKFLMTSAQIDVLDAFYTSTLGGGALRFEWAHPRTGVVKQWRITEPPQWAPAGTTLMWHASVKLEVVP